MKKNLLSILVSVLIVVMAIGLMGCSLEHIEDTNGAEDYSLTTITDQQIIDGNMGTLNMKKKTGAFSGMVEFYSDQFTGVYEIVYDDYIYVSEVLLQLYDFTVTAGNFKMCVIHEDQIVAVLEPGDLVEYRLEDVSGMVRLVIAGESAAFHFEMTESDYDRFSHD